MQDGTIHVVGVAGVGMSALARVCRALGRPVTGSDRYWGTGQNREIFDKLAACGVDLKPQDGSGVDARTARVVVSTAIEPDNPDLRAAASRGIPVVHRAAFLAELAAGRPLIAVTGTSGKTTVTGMTGVMLEALGADPMVVNGGAVLNWATDREIGNVRPGSGPWVIEADESDRSLLAFHPDWAIVTNMSGDHFGIEETRLLFEAFRRQVRRAVIGPELPLPDGEPFAPVLERDQVHFSWRGLRVRVPVPGRHNAENALQALTLCAALGYAPEAAVRALASFRGIVRRLQGAEIGARGVAVIDDYAHNPAKIEAAWRTVAPHYGRVLGVWRPHGFGPLAAMMDELAALFPRLCAGGSRLFLLPVYYAGGTAHARVTADELADRVRKAGAPVVCCSSYDALETALLAEARAGDAVLVMGARDPELPVFCRRLAARMRESARPIFPHREFPQC